VPEIEPRLRKELAAALYAQDILPFGKASEPAGVSRFDFAEAVSQRNVARHYGEEDLTRDIDYARGQ
jgi:predicted HTH domain antitoxin